MLGNAVVRARRIDAPKRPQSSTAGAAALGGSRHCKEGLPRVRPWPNRRFPRRPRRQRSADLPVGVLEGDHITTGYGNPLGGHGRSAARHVPGRVGLAEGAF
jgi:hypothetical protein